MKQEAITKMIGVIEFCIDIINDDKSLSAIQEMIILKRIELAKPKKRIRKAFDVLNVENY